MSVQQLCPQHRPAGLFNPPPHPQVAPQEVVVAHAAPACSLLCSSSAWGALRWVQQVMGRLRLGGLGAVLGVFAPVGGVGCPNPPPLPG